MNGIFQIPRSLSETETLWFEGRGACPSVAADQPEPPCGGVLGSPRGRGEAITSFASYMWRMHLIRPSAHSALETFMSQSERTFLIMDITVAIYRVFLVALNKVCLIHYHTETPNGHLWFLPVQFIAMI